MNSSSLRPFAPRLLAAFSTAALVAAVGLFASSRPARTAGGPIPVTVTNASLTVTDADAARQAVSGSILLFGTVFAGTLYTVPANKRLVVETVSVIGNRYDANTYIIQVETTQGGALRHTFLNLLPNGAPYPAFSQPLRLYADPGTRVDISVDDNGNNSPAVGLSFFGHLVDL